MTGSQAGTQAGMYGKTNRQDLMKIDRASRHINHMINAKKPIDAALSLIHACKDAFPNLKRCTIFVVDPRL